MALRSTILEFEDAFLADVREWFPKEAVRSIIKHQGEFGARECEEYAVNANALILTSSASSSTTVGNLINAFRTYDMFVLVKGKTYEKRGDACTIIVEHFLKWLHDARRWTIPAGIDFKAPSDVEDRNLYNAKVDDMGLALWIIRWKQLLQIPMATEQESTLNDFRILWVQHFRVGEGPPDDEPISEQRIELEQ